MTLLEIESLTMQLPGGRRLLENVDLRVESGRTVGLVGESGSGKSLTARAVLGLLGRDITASGTVRVEDEDVLGMAPQRLRRLRREEVAMVFQDPRAGINPVRTVGDHLTESLRLGGGVPRAVARKQAVDLMGAVRLPRPEKHFDQYPHELSGGQLQRVMIAGALMGDPRLLVCDEPTTALDVTTQMEIVRLLARLRDERGMGMLFITHDLGLAGALCDEIVVMQRGRVEERGHVRAVLDSPSAEYTRKLVAATPSVRLDAWRAERAPAQVAERAASPLAGGASADTAADPVLLRVSGVSRSYERPRKEPVRAVVDASFEVPRASALGVVGESGSGKSTLARMVVGLESPDAGTITVAGKDRTGSPRGRAQRLEYARSVQMVFQDPYLSLDPRIPVLQAVEDAVRLHPDDRDPVRVAETLLDRVGLTSDQMQARPRTLSGGQRQRVALARAVAVQPQLLVMDEATSALDVSVQAQVLELVSELQTEQGLTVLFISHDLGVVQQVCDQTLVLQRGEIVEAGPTGALLRSPRHPYTLKLLESVPGADSGWQSASA
ncbi:ABC transporter ATP-binding protein [Kocuria rhizophila]|uniref:dipeptide ABC transporter ATP-binding protein n=1 Tax=Kocuria rhizophila TaxID=72000 RepID=UPI00069D822B|nr:ABC transporter ATP-binding protein [Kocuria rhizophila]MCR4526342.1 ABC transporter ATP-binding protein [Kocuria rhizophila]